MVKNFVRVVGVLALALAGGGIVVGCNDNTTEPEAHVWGRLTLTRIVDQFSHGDSVYGNTQAEFYQDADSRAPIEAGTVKFNGHTEPFMVTKQYYYTDTVPTSPNFDVWAISGKGDIPAFRLEIPTADLPRINSLKANDTIHYLQTTKLDWLAGIEGDSVGINIDDASGHVYIDELPNSGTGFIKPEKFLSPNSGPAFVYVFRNNSATSQTGNKLFTATSQFLARVRVYLAP